MDDPEGPTMTGYGSTAERDPAAAAWRRRLADGLWLAIVCEFCIL
jgi:hypothetical protein